MKQIDRVGKTLTRISAKRTKVAETYEGASKGNRVAKSKINDSAIETESLKLAIHKKLQGINLATKHGKEAGRMVFIEFALQNEFGIDSSELNFQTNLASKINCNIFGDSALRSELDALLKNLQKNAKSV